MSNIINVARGFEKADLVIKNANIVNVLSEEIHKADIAIVDGIIAGIGENYSGEKEIDVNGAYVTPSFIDGHVHLESTMMLPSEFAKVAREEGFENIAKQFEGVAKVEKEHEERYRKLLANVKDGLVFSKDGDTIWECANCGHICVGKKAPEVCPVCAHPKSFFAVRAENY